MKEEEMKRRIKRLKAVILIGMLFFGLAATGCDRNGASGQGGAQGEGEPLETSEAVAPITWDFACSWVQGNFNYTRLELFADIVEEITDGRLIINIVGGPEVIEASETTEACVNGVIDGAYTSCGYAAGYIPIGEVVSVSDMTNAEMNSSGATDFLRDVYSESGLYYYAAVNEVVSTRFHIYVNKPVETLADLKDRRIRASLGLWNDVASALGMVPSPLAFTEVYTALEQGLIEGYMAPAFSGVNEGFFEYSKHMIFPGIGRPGTVMPFNLESWEALPGDLREILLDNTDYITTEWDEQVDKGAMDANIAALEEHGGSVITLADGDAEKLTDTFNEIGWASIAKNCPDYDMEELKKIFMK
jgi:TRAP-type C4-dicarboxylate transport system substrate-binding protein